MEAANPYEPPKSPLESEIAEPHDMSKLIATYVDENVEYYEEHIQNFLAGKKFLGFNYAAAIFTVPWLAYRRMYVYLLYFVLADTMLGALVELLYQGGIINHGKKILVFYVCTVALRLIIGSYINFIYLKVAKSKVLKMSGMYSDPDILVKKIAFAGGTNGWSCTLAVTVNLTLGILAKMV